jgi:hypothetical protein
LIYSIHFCIVFLPTLDVIKVQGATGDYFTNVMAKGEEAYKLICGERKRSSIIRCKPSMLIPAVEYDFGFIHIKAVDDAGHDKRLDLKVGDCSKILKLPRLHFFIQIKFLEDIDNMVGHLVSKFTEFNERKNQNVTNYTKTIFQLD